MDERAHSYSGGRLKEFVRLVATTHVRGGETSLQQNAGRQVAALAHLAISGNLSVTE